jgi:hypothetical protein
MTTGALIFMLVAWAFVLGLMAWSFGKILRGKKHFDPDGIGPASPPEPGKFDSRTGPRRVHPRRHVGANVSDMAPGMHQDAGEVSRSRR